MSKDFAEKLSDSRKMHSASDGASETSGKIFLAENDQGYGQGNDPDFRTRYVKTEAF